MGLLRFIIALYLVTAATPIPTRADVTLPRVIGAGMVLQRGQPVPIWGQASPGEAVTVRFAGQQKDTHADGTGRWEVRLDALPASDTPRDLTVAGHNTIQRENILVGEVWLCSGQSNMEYPMAPTPNYGPAAAGKAVLARDLAAARDPGLRLFKVQKVLSTPDVTTDGWQECGPDSAATFSAVAYYFGKQLRQELKVPVGLIQSAWGGTRIEPWTPPEAYAADPAFRPETQTTPLEVDGVRPGKNYASMIRPLMPFAVRGVVWYQGESNCINNDGLRYADKMRALVDGWRAAWGEGDFPFYYVQIAPCRYTARHDPKPHTSEDLPALWEAQTLALAIPNTGIVGTLDLADNLNNIHPTDKWDVGGRLALLALARTYGRTQTVCSGPQFQSATFGHGAARVTFHLDGIGGGLTSRDGKPLTFFQVTGADGRFVPAVAEIQGRAIVVSSPAVPAPTAVRFAWDEAAQPNLCNKEGLPALPFRTDHDALPASAGGG